MTAFNILKIPTIDYIPLNTPVCDIFQGEVSIFRVVGFNKKENIIFLKGEASEGYTHILEYDTNPFENCPIPEVMDNIIQVKADLTNGGYTLPVKDEFRNYIIWGEPDEWVIEKELNQFF